MEYFTATRSFRLQMTSLFDFMHPTTAALWNLRQQIHAYEAEHPDATVTELWQRFYQDSGIPAANRKRIALAADWPAQCREIAKFSLFAMTAIYEGWTDEIVASFPGLSAKQRKELPKALQYPTAFAPGGVPTGGVRFVIAELVKATTPMQQSFATALRRPRKPDPLAGEYRLDALDELLIVFRAFKEARNCFAHANGLADRKAVEAHRQAQSVTPAQLHMRSVSLPNVTGERDALSVSLDQVMGYLQVISRIVATVDAELCASAIAEAEFVRGWKAKWSQPEPLQLGRDGLVGGGQVRMWLEQAGLPPAEPTGPVTDYLLKNGMCSRQKIWPKKRQVTS